MTRYWVIAPYHADNAPLYKRVWQFDLVHARISVGWSKLGDITHLGREDLREAFNRVYPGDRLATQVGAANMLWRFHHEIQPGDRIIARRGTKAIAGVGTVIGSAYYDISKSPLLESPDRIYPNHLDVSWHERPREKRFDRIISLWSSCDELRGGMDVEIAALEARFAKTRQLKQGMMRELLTGKIRLV